MSARGFSLGCLVVAVLWLVGPPSAVAADLSVPANVDSHLQRLLERWNSTATSSTNVAPQTVATPLDT